MVKANIISCVEDFNKKKFENCSDFELNLLAEEILELLMNVYSQNIDLFVQKHSKMNDFELNKWIMINEMFYKKEDVKLLDCAFGNGRDLLYAKNIGFDVYGCELNKDLYNRVMKQKLFMPDRIFNADIRDLPFASNMFNVVRHNASFLHMPLIGKGYTIDKTIEESYRVLKDGGLLYVLTKRGEGYCSIDSGEGLGERPFQLFYEKDLEKLILSYGFHILNINTYIRKRNEFKVEWIEVLAQK